MTKKNQQFSHIVETYLAMQKTKGMSAQAAIKLVCAATGRNYNDRYLNGWPTVRSTVPDDAVRWMQLESGYFAAQMIGCQISKDDAIELAIALSNPVKKG